MRCKDTKKTNKNVGYYIFLCNFAAKFDFMHKIIIGLLGIALLCSCNKKDDPEPTPEPTVYDRTVLVYMSGENDLTTSGFMADDLLEMDEGSYQLNDDQHLIVFIDSVGTTNPPHIIEIAKGKRKVLYQYNTEFAASDPSKFREVIQWTIDNYPSKDYGLVLWGHATGWAVDADSVANVQRTRAYGYDYGYDSYIGRKAMNITQMAKALEDMPKFKYIFADCCCFMCVESAYELRNAADYLIGSPAEIPGAGAPYDRIMSSLFSNSNTFYQNICDIYYDFYLDAYNSSTYDYLNLDGYSVPMSAVKLSEMESLAQATNQILATISSEITSPAVLDLSKLPFYFASTTYTDMKVMYDMSSVFYKYASVSDYTQWLTAYNKAVPYSLVSTKWQTVYNTLYNSFDSFPDNNAMWGGLSMYFPQQGYDNYNYKFNTRIKNYQWYYSVNWSKYGW